jgi:ABC-type phosphate transport system ATPase subunit
MQETNPNSKIENTSKLLTINKLNVYYGKKHAVEDLTIEVQSGIILGLLGQMVQAKPVPYAPLKDY